MPASLKHKILSGVFWQGLERVGSQGISFVISIVLARLLSPDEFGVLAILLVFTSLCGVFIDAGFCTALIQKKDLQQEDCCSVFYINLVMGGLLYGLIFIGAPSAAAWYQKPELALYLRIMALKLPISSLSLVQNAMLNKQMLFNLNFRIKWVALLVSGTLGILLAYRGYGVWALIAQQLSIASVTALMQWILVGWHPQWLFDWGRIWRLFNFGWKMFCSVLLDTLFNDAYPLLVGKFFSLKTLSFYQRGVSLPSLAMGFVSSITGQVLLPAFSSIQDSREEIRDLAEKSLKTIMFVMVPVLALIAIFARPFVLLFLTAKWVPCVIYIQLGCLIYFFWPFHTLNLQIVTACGRSDLFLILEIIKKTQFVLMLLITWRWGIVATVWGMGVVGLLAAIENSWPNIRLIHYPPWKQFLHTVPSLMLAGAASVPSMFCRRWIASPGLCMLIGGVCFGCTYLGLALLCHQVPPLILKMMPKMRCLGTKA